MIPTPGGKKIAEKKPEIEAQSADGEKSIAEIIGNPEHTASAEFLSELESVIDEMMFEHQDATTGPNAQNEPPADPSEGGATNASVAAEYEIEKSKETFEVTLGQATEEMDPGIDLDPIRPEQEDPVGGLPDLALEKEADTETGEESEIEKKPESHRSNKIVTLGKAPKNGKDPRKPGEEAGVAKALKKKKITQAELKPIPKRENTRQAEKKAHPKTINPKPSAASAKEAIKPVSKEPHEVAGVTEALKKAKINQAGLKPIPKKKDTRQAEKKAHPKTISPKPVAVGAKEAIKPVSNARSPRDFIFRRKKQNRAPGSKEGRKTRRAVWLIGGVLIVTGIVFSYRLVFPDKQTPPTLREKLAQPMTTFKIKQPVAAVEKALKPKPDLKIKQSIAPPENSVPEAAAISRDAPGPVADITTAMVRPTAKVEVPKVATKTPVAVRPPILPPARAYPYSIHATSYRSREAAEIDIQQFRQVGLPAFWVKVDLGEKGIWYRVFCGYFKTAEAAQKAIKQKQLRGARSYPCRYANFIGAYSSASQLEKERRVLADRGYAPYVIRQDNGTHLLFLGGHTLRRDTEKFASELSARGIRSTVVQR